MGSFSVSVGTVVGIRVYLDYTLVIAFGLVGWTLAVGYMPNEYPGYGPQAYWAIEGASATILFLSVFIHELGHSYVAKRNGLSISKIVLFIFGGVAQMGEEAPSPRVEFKVSLVGPATSFVIAGLLGLAYWHAEGMGRWYDMLAGHFVGSLGTGHKIRPIMFERANSIAKAPIAEDRPGCLDAEL